MEPLVTELAKLGAVGLIAGLFSSFLSNRDHRQRAWWEMRVSAYREVIDALADLVYYYDQHFQAEARYHELPEQLKAELEASWGPAFRRVRKAADSGAFLLSTEAFAAVSEFVRSGREEHDSFVDHLLDRLNAAGTCLNKLVELSKKDLEIKARFFWLPDRWA